MKQKCTESGQSQPYKRYNFSLTSAKAENGIFAEQAMETTRILSVIKFSALMQMKLVSKSKYPSGYQK
jgi:hypothetical protein